LWEQFADCGEEVGRPRMHTTPSKCKGVQREDVSFRNEAANKNSCGRPVKHRKRVETNPYPCSPPARHLPGLVLAVQCS